MCEMTGFPRHVTVKCHRPRDLLPISQWLPHYDFSCLRGDLIAGFTVGLMVIPQGLAYGLLSGLGPQFGLYSAFMGCFVYVFLGTSKDLTLGPTAIMSLMTAQFCATEIGKYDLALLLCLITGLIQLVMGFLRMGIIVDFFSHPVISGFTTAAAVIIAWGQVQSLLGLKNISREFFHSIYDIFANIKSTNVWDLALGISCIFALVLLKWLLTVSSTNKDEEGVSRHVHVARNILWFLCTCRNALVVLCAALVAVLLNSLDMQVFSLTQHMAPGLPTPRLPAFQVRNGTDIVYTFGEMISTLGTGLVVVPFIGLVEAIAIGKFFAQKSGYRLCPNQELIAIGMSNICGTFFQSYPVTGSFSRTAVNAQSGVRTPAGGVVTGVVAILALACLTPYFVFIPTAALAAVIMVAVVQMLEFDFLIRLCCMKSWEVVPWLVTFGFATGLGIENGIFVGIGVSFVPILYHAARGGIKQKGKFLSNYGAALFFPYADYLEQKIQAHFQLYPAVQYCVLDFTSIKHVDYTVAAALRNLAANLEKLGKTLIVISPKKSVRDSIFIGKSHLPGLEMFEDAAKASIAFADMSELRVILHDCDTSLQSTSHSLRVPTDQQS